MTDVVFDVWRQSSRTVSPSIALVRDMEQGLPASVVDDVARRVAPDQPDFRHRLVPKATLARRRGVRLSPDESARVLRLAEVWQLALEVWKSDAAARSFLNGPHMLLQNRTPLDLALSSEVGARLVKEQLEALLYGFPV